MSGDTLVGYWIGREYWGKGVASRALALFLMEVDERPLHAYVATHNAGSLDGCWRSAGSGSWREQTIEESGERIDEVILRLDWRSSDGRDLRGERPRRQAAEHEHHRLCEHDGDRHPDPGEQELADHPALRMDADREGRERDDRRRQDHQRCEERARRPLAGLSAPRSR